jgi:putative membrane protein insertion efficiency factor
VKYVLIGLLKVWRLAISPLYGNVCRYYPSCSAYAEQAVLELGPLRGFVVALWRLVRCNPFSSGGLDPLDSRRLFRSEGADADAEHREVPV